MSAARRVSNVCLYDEYCGGTDRYFIGKDEDEDDDDDERLLGDEDGSICKFSSSMVHRLNRTVSCC